jgi:hypothetical protein
MRLDFRLGGMEMRRTGMNGGKVEQYIENHSQRIARIAI